MMGVEKNFVAVLYLCTTVTVRLCILFIAVAPKQVDYMNEVKEFEAEMRKHSHKFPHDILYTLDTTL